MAADPASLTGPLPARSRALTAPQVRRFGPTDLLPAEPGLWERSLDGQDLLMPTATAFVRPYRPEDRPELYDICVRTAYEGGDSRHIYPDPELMPGIFAAPYAALEPELAFVLDDGDGRAVGYILGTADTPAFVTAFRKVWLPSLTGRYPEPSGPPRTPSEEMIALLHRPERMIVPQLAEYPAHLHIDLLPGWQRAGHGRALMDTFLDALHRRGIGAVHLSMVPANTGARAFYDRMGFAEIAVPGEEGVTYLGRATAPLTGRRSGTPAE